LGEGLIGLDTASFTVFYTPDLRKRYLQQVRQGYSGPIFDGDKSRDATPLTPNAQPSPLDPDEVASALEREGSSTAIFLIMSTAPAN